MPSAACLCLLSLMALFVCGCKRTEHARPAEVSDMGIAKRPATFTISQLMDVKHRGVHQFALDKTTQTLFVSFDDSWDAELGSLGDALFQWDVATRTLVHTYRFEPGWIIDGIFPSERSARLVVQLFRRDDVPGKPSVKYQLVNTAKHTVIAADLGLHDRIAKVQFSQGGDLVRLTAESSQEPTPRILTVDSMGRPVNAKPEQFPSAAPTRLRMIESSKFTMTNHGLYYVDDKQQEVRLTSAQWHDNYALSMDGRYVVATTWDGELLIFSTRPQADRVMYRNRVSKQHCYLVYDEKSDRYLLGDATPDGTTFVRELRIQEPR